MLYETITDVSGEVAPQRLLAGNKSEAAGQLLSHEVSSLSDLILARIRDEIFHDEFPSGNTSDCNRSFHHRQDDLQEWILVIGVPKHWSSSERTSRTARSIARCTALLKL